MKTISQSLTPLQIAELRGSIHQMSQELSTELLAMPRSTSELKLRMEINLRQGENLLLTRSVSFGSGKAENP